MLILRCYRYGNMVMPHAGLPASLISKLEYNSDKHQRYCDRNKHRRRYILRSIWQNSRWTIIQRGPGPSQEKNLHINIPVLSNPRMSFPTELVLPVSASCLCRNSRLRACPLPLSSSPCVNTPSRVDLPASTLPTTATLKTFTCLLIVFVNYM